MLISKTDTEHVVQWWSSPEINKDDDDSPLQFRRPSTRWHLLLLLRLLMSMTAIIGNNC